MSNPKNKNMSANKVNTNPDKREMMMFRELLKILLIIAFSIFATILIQENVINDDNKPKKVIILVNKSKNNKIISKNNEIKYPINVVIKTSKDIKKYFISYKHYYNKNKYDVFVKEISFREYMVLDKNDTINAL